MRETLEALLERVEKATGADRELGFEIMRACGCHRGMTGYFLGPLYYWSWPDRESYGSEDSIKSVTESVDAAIKLVEKALPHDWLVGFEWGQRGTLADAWIRWKFSEDSSEAQGRTPALAILAALLQALIAKASSHGGEG